jgi:hypothetical protein
MKKVKEDPEPPSFSRKLSSDLAICDKPFDFMFSPRVEEDD